MEHKLGIFVKSRKNWDTTAVYRQVLNYEPPWRYYYIVRNSTILLIEGKIDILFYLWQIIRFLIPIVFIDGFLEAIRALIMGLSHGFFKKLGYVDPQKLGLLSSLKLDRLQKEI